MKHVLLLLMGLLLTKVVANADVHPVNGRTTSKFIFIVPVKPFEYDWRNRDHIGLFFIYDKDKDGYLDGKEINQIEADVLGVAKDDKRLSVAELINLTKQLQTKILHNIEDDQQYFSNLEAKMQNSGSEDITEKNRIYTEQKALRRALNDKKVTNITPQMLLRFIHNVCGAVIGTNLQESVNSGFIFKGNLEQTKSLINLLNAENISQANYTYSNAFKRKFVVDDIMDNFSFKNAKPMIEIIVNATAQACRTKNVKIDVNLREFNKAMASDNKDGVRKYANNLIKMLDSTTANEVRAAEHAEGYWNNRPLGYINSKILKDYMANKTGLNENDIFGDGIVGNSKVYPMSKKGKTLLKVVNELFKDEVFKEKVCACVSKIGPCICVNIRKTKMGYSCDCNQMISSGYGIITSTVIGDGDLSALLSAIYHDALKAKAIKAGEEIDETKLKRFIQYLFE